jgi:hypothetical protein
MATAAPALAAPLDSFLEQLSAIRREANALTSDLGDAAFAWSPEPGVWSAAEIVQHLNVSARLYLDALAHALSGSRTRGLTDRGDYRHSLVGGWFARSLEPPPRLRLRAPKVLRPAAERRPADRAALLATWRAVHDELEERLREAAGLDLRRTRVVSPISSLVRMNAGDAFLVLLAHERRHLFQLRRLRDRPGFPG